MPALVRLYIRHVLIGFALSGVFTGLLFWLNVANLWHLVRATQGGTIALVMLLVFNGLVFAGVQFAIAVMRMAEDRGPGGGGRKTPSVAHAQPATLAIRVGVEPRRG
ncbi:MAG: hypothetical protein KDD88_11980 [Rhodobacteraceae bacterium]|nr:hypothetical protein [Paracoccaceae bacterium]